MTQQPLPTEGELAHQLTGEAIVTAFPMPGPMLEGAYWKLRTAKGEATPALTAVLGPPEHLPRPWIPASCYEPELRKQLWEWLEAVAVWLNEQYTWDATAMIPACWSHHPHIINDLAVLADRRRAAGHEYDGAAMEEWERQTLPLFIERMHTRLRQQCATGQHKPWPGRPRHQTYLAPDASQHRTQRLTRDIAALKGQKNLHTSGLPLTIVATRTIDVQTGETRDL